MADHHDGDASMAWTRVTCLEHWSSWSGCGLPRANRTALALPWMRVAGRMARISTPQAGGTDRSLALIVVALSSIDPSSTLLLHCELYRNRPLTLALEAHERPQLVPRAVVGIRGASDKCRGRAAALALRAFHFAKIDFMNRHVASSSVPSAKGHRAPYFYVWSSR